MIGKESPRESVAELFWNELSQTRTNSNFRRELSILRKHLGDFLSISLDFVGINPSSNVQLDAKSLQTATQTIEHGKRKISDKELARAKEDIDLYRGDFLAGFHLRGATGFENWADIQREYFRQLAITALGDLVSYYTASGGYGDGIARAKQLLRLDPLLESSHRQLMRLLALNNQRQLALEQFKQCKQRLKKDLGVEPANETIELYEVIRAGKFDLPGKTVEIKHPTFLDEKVEHKAAVFVGRDKQIARLEADLKRAVNGQGGLIFISGEAGRGKSALLREFGKRVGDKYEDLIVVWGRCKYFGGENDPYKPFRRVMEMLTGNVEGEWQMGEISHGQALRLWNLLPEISTIVVEEAEDLLGTLIPLRSFTERVASHSDITNFWLGPQTDMLAGKEEEPLFGELNQAEFIRQYIRVLKRVSKRRPILILLDDLQWIDQSSLVMLASMGQEIRNHPILIAGTYRSEELSKDRNRPHSLGNVLSEFKGQFGDVFIDLDRNEPSENRAFVDYYLDEEANNLSSPFRQNLTELTNGHALFLKELLHEMQEREYISKDSDNKWVETEKVRWDKLPAKVEGVIEKRLSRLDRDLQEILAVASIEGKQFTAEVVAGVLNQDVSQVVHRISNGLQKDARLVEDQKAMVINARRFSRYRFSHDLIQKYVYFRMGENQRSSLHGEVAKVIETEYSEHTDDFVNELALHFARAGKTEKAIKYYRQSGESARKVYAYQEAIRAYEAALELLEKVGDRDQATQMQMILGLVYHENFDYGASRKAYQAGFGFPRDYDVFRPAVEEHAYQGAVKFYDPALSDAERDPGKGVTIHDGKITDQLFSGLVERDPVIGIAPDIAQSWEVLNDGRVYLFKLRRDVSWSDGTQLTARDFVGAWRRALHKNNNSEAASFLFDIKNGKKYHLGQIGEEKLGVKALDDFTLEVELEEPVGYFLYVVAISPSFPIPMHIVERHGEKWTDVGNIVTNGPFLLKEFTNGKLLTLSRNPRYHGYFPGNVETIHVELNNIPPEERLSQYEKEQIDNFYLSTIKDVRSYSNVVNRWSTQHTTFTNQGVVYFLFDLERPPFADKRVRQAFAYATDKTAFSHIAAAGRIIPAYGGFIPPQVPGHSHEIGLGFNPDKARKLLLEAGYPKGTGFPEIRAYFEYYYQNSSYDDSVAFLETQWLDVLGVEITFEKALGYKNTKQFKKGKAQIISRSYTADFPDPHTFFTALESELSHLQWTPPSYRTTLNLAKKQLDAKIRVELYKKLDRLLIKNVILLPISYTSAEFLRKPWISDGYYGPLASGWWKGLIVKPH